MVCGCYVKWLWECVKMEENSGSFKKTIANRKRTVGMTSKISRKGEVQFSLEVYCGQKVFVVVGLPNSDIARS